MGVFQGVPNEDEINAFHHHHDELFNKARAKWEEADKFYRRDFELWLSVPENLRTKYPRFHSSAATNTIDHAVDALTTYDPQVTRPRKGEGEREQAAADRIEHAVKALFNDAFLQETFHPAKQVGKHFILHNYGVVESYLDLRHRAERPKRKDGESQDDFETRDAEWEAARLGWNPMRARAVQPGEVLMDPLEKQPDEALHQYELPAWKVKDLAFQKIKLKRPFAREFETKDIDPYQPIKLWRVLTARHQVVMEKGGSIIWVERNALGFQPFAHAWGGGGLVPVGVEFSLEYLAEGFLQPVMESIRMNDERMAAEAMVLFRAAFAKKGTRLNAAQAAQATAQGNWLSGEEEDYWLEKNPQLPTGMDKLGEELSKDIEEGTFSKQAAGFRQTGVDTATQQLVLSEATNRKFGIITTQMNNLFSIVGSNFLRMAKKLDEVYGVGSLTLGRHELRVTDIGNNYRLEVTFPNVDPVVQAQAQQMAMTEYEKFLLPWEDYQRVARREDVTGLRKRLLEDKGRANPAVDAERQSLIIEIMGYRQAAKMLREQMQAQQGLVDPNGQPLAASNGNGRTP